MSNNKLMLLSLLIFIFFILAFIFTILTTFIIYHANCNQRYNNVNTNVIKDPYLIAGNITGVDYRLIKAVAKVESGMIHWARGDRGKAHGEMQVHMVVAKMYGIHDKNLLYNKQVNLVIGAAFLRDMIKKYGVKGGIQAYNLGETKYCNGKRNLRYYFKVVRQI